MAIILFRRFLFTYSDVDLHSKVEEAGGGTSVDTDPPSVTAVAALQQKVGGLQDKLRTVVQRYRVLEKRYKEQAQLLKERQQQ